MRFPEILLSAAVGGVIGFAASEYAGSLTSSPPQETNTKDAVSMQLSDLGITNKSSLEDIISAEVSKFLNEKPEAVVAALEKYQENQAKVAEVELVNTLRSLKDALLNQSNDPSLGATAAEADVTLVEFFDYRCGYCKRVLPSVMELAKSDKKLRIVMKEFPILGPDSVTASIISLASNMVNPDKYGDLHDRLMQHQGPYDEATLLAIAADAGYDPSKIQAAMTDKSLNSQIQNARAIAEALNIRGTPAFIIGDKIIPGAVPLQQLRSAIEEARANSSNKS